MEFLFNFPFFFFFFFFILLFLCYFLRIPQNGFELEEAFIDKDS